MPLRRAFLTLCLFSCTYLEGTEKVGKMIERVQDLSLLKETVLRSGLGAYGRYSHQHQFAACGLKNNLVEAGETC